MPSPATPVPPPDPAPAAARGSWADIAGAVALLAVLWLALPAPVSRDAGDSTSADCLALGDAVSAPTPEHIAMLERCSAVLATDAELLADLGAAYEGRGDAAAAEAAYLRALAIDADQAGVHLRLGRLLLRRGAAAEARAHAQAALAIQPNRRVAIELRDEATRAEGSRVIWFGVVAVSRLAVIALALVTWAYSLTTYSAFAYDMFVQPRLFPWLADFVAWHHMWCLAAYAVSVLTLLPELMALRRTDTRWRVAPWLAVAYVAVFGVVAANLTHTPYLPSLPAQAATMAAALMPFVPVVWLALIDLCGGVPAVRPATAPRPALGLARLFVACLTTTAVVWAVHFSRVAFGTTPPSDPAGWLLAALWTFALVLNAFIVVFAVLNVIVHLAARVRHAGAAEFALATAAFGVAIGEFFRRLVFGSLAFDRADPAWLAAIGGIALALAWAGLARRGAAARRRPVAIGLETLVGWGGLGAVLTAAALVAVPLAALWLFGRIEQVDWDFVAQRTVAAVECGLVFGLALGLTTRLGGARWPWRRFALPIACALVLLYAMPWAARLVPRGTGTRDVPADALLDQLASADPVFGLVARGLVAQPRPDATYFREVLRSSARSLETPRAVPDVEFARPIGVAPARRPHVFMFVVDSLRRDYLSPVNPAVRFTPNIDAWSRESFVFRNAFTRYGGTWLAIPSMWVGGELPRSWGRMPFPKVNALEKLVTANGYHLVLNDYTVSASLRPDPSRTFIDGEARSVGSDLCRQVDQLQGILDRRDARPVFAFLAPMNVHVLGTTPAPPDAASRDAYRGFNEAYAAKLQRVDQCFGRFLAYLRQTGLDDESIVILTSDHGDSLGEAGQWGHSYTLFPEVVRIPLVIGLPRALRASVTTDLAQIAFSTDVVPTLYRLMGYEVRDLGPHFGSPLFTDVAGDLPSRRRDSFLIMSSYGATYGLLRRNGRLLYVSDSVSAREYAYDLRQEPLGHRVALGGPLRGLNQSLMRARIAGLEAIHHPDAGSGDAGARSSPTTSAH